MSKNDPLKHKPSRKRTLEDVLRSLQDLADNELSGTSLKKVLGELETFEPNQDTTKPPAEVNPGPVTDPDPQPDASTAPADDSANDPADDMDLEDLSMDELTAELAASSEALEDDTDLDDIDLSGDLAEAPDMPEPSFKADTKALKGVLPGQLPINWDDIPVLENIATAKPVPAAEPAPAAPLHFSLTPEQIRQLAIQAAARVNIELRHYGEDELDPATIQRLEFWLRKELEPLATKSDNSDPE